MAVVRSKLRPPSPRADTLTRAALIGRLGQAAADVVLLVGPAGHGKSTTLAQLYGADRDAGRRTLWLTLDEADNEPRVLVPQLCALLGGLDGAGQPSTPAAALHHPGWWIERLEQCAEPVSLFLDDFHLLEAPGLVAFFRRLVGMLPEGTRLYVASRALPELGLSRLAPHGKLCVLDAADLCFSRAELALLCADAGLSGVELGALHSRTGGWPAALQLFRMALANPRVRASLADPAGPQLRALSVYLSENVLALQAPELQEFLLHTAPLERVSVELARRVTGRDDAAALIGRLERAGFFVRASDPEASTYRYHPLLAQWLGEQLAARSPACLRAAHRHAVAHYEAAGDHAGVLRHALACDELARAAAALDAWASDLVASGRLATLERWLALLPLERVIARPSLCIKASYAFVFLRRQDRLAALRAVLESRPSGPLGETRDPSVVLALHDVCVRDEPPRALMCEHAAPPVAPGGFAAFELAAMHNLISYRELCGGDFARCREHIALARVYGERTAAPFSGAYTDTLTSAVLLLTGDLSAALAEQRAALARRAVEDEDSFASASLVAVHVWALYEAEAYGEASALFARHARAIARATMPDLLTVSYGAAARAIEAQGDPRAAAALRSEARALAHAEGWSRPHGLFAWEEVRSALRRGERARAEQLAARAPEPARLGPGLRLAEHFAAPHLVQANLMVACGQLGQAELLVGQASERPAGAYLQLQCGLILASLAEARGAEGSARRSARRVLRRAAQGGFTRIAGEIPAGLAALGDELPADADMVAPAAPVVALGLSDRELEVLQQLAFGTSNRDIARAMFVSENTIKFHLKSLYVKLQVEGRVQAVRAAQRLGVIRG